MDLNNRKMKNHPPSSVHIVWILVNTTIFTSKSKLGRYNEPNPHSQISKNSFNINGTEFDFRWGWFLYIFRFYTNTKSAINKKIKYSVFSRVRWRLPPLSQRPNGLPLFFAVIRRLLPSRVQSTNSKKIILLDFYFTLFIYVILYTSSSRVLQMSTCGVVILTSIVYFRWSCVQNEPNLTLLNLI